MRRLCRPCHRRLTARLDRGNLRRASALLDEAGWVAGRDGIRRKDGQTLDAVFLNSPRILTGSSTR